MNENRKRGRPKKEQNRRNKSVSFRLTDDEMYDLERCSKLERLTRTELLTMALRKFVGEVDEKHSAYYDSFGYDDDDFEDDDYSW